MDTVVDCSYVKKDKNLVCFATVFVCILSEKLFRL